MTYLVRVALPDRPGALGGLATAFGEVGADIVSLDVVERFDGVAVDDLLVELPSGGLADSLLTAVSLVDGATVESLRPWSGGVDLRRDLELVDALAAEPASALACLAAESPGVFRAGWGLLLAGTQGDVARVVAASPAAPQVSTVELPGLPLARARRVIPDEEWVPPSWRALGTEMAVAPVGRPDRVLLVGRPGGPRFLDSEVVRLAHLAGLAASVAGAA